MTHKHTSGPWTTDEAEHDCPYQDISIRAGRRTICRVWIDDAPVPDYNAEQDANAKLIAAAPDLLTALEACLQVLRANGDNFGRRAQLAADAAITKATK